MMRQKAKPEPKTSRPSRVEPIAEAASQKTYSYYSGMGKEELIRYAKDFATAGGISYEEDLKRADEDLHLALLARGLLEDVGLPGNAEEKSRTRLNQMRDGVLLAYAEWFNKQGGIRSAAELEGADCILHSILKQKGLLDAVFSDPQAESSAHAKAVDGVIGALGSFGDGK